MFDINKFIDDVIEKEGGYCDHADDRGGPTCWGITEQIARANGYAGAMKDLPRDTAVAIYRDQYFISPGFEKVSKLSARIAAEIADTGVNMGPQTAAKFLQICLNVLNREQKDYPDIVADGWIGNGTLASLGQYLKVRGKDGEDVMLKALNCLQGARYISIAEKDRSQESFVYGWLRGRVEL